MNTLKMYRIVDDEWQRVDRETAGGALQPLAIVAFVLALLAGVFIAGELNLFDEVEQILTHHGGKVMVALIVSMLIIIFWLGRVEQRLHIKRLRQWGMVPEKGSRKFSIINGMKEHFGVEYDHSIPYMGNVLTYRDYLNDISK